jgi:hypothetical protein
MENKETENKMREGTSGKEVRKLSKEDLELIASSVDKYGDILIATGKIEKRIGKPIIELVEKIGETGLSEIVKKFEKAQKFSARIGAIITKLILISPKLDKFIELPPDEKIRIGGSIKEISGLIRELVEGV